MSNSNSRKKKNKVVHRPCEHFLLAGENVGRKVLLGEFADFATHSKFWFGFSFRAIDSFVAKPGHLVSN